MLPFPDIVDGRWEATIDGGHSPLWSPDGRELFFYSGGTMWAVPIDTEPTFRAGNPEPLFQGTYQVGDLLGDLRFWPFDIAPDGERFLMRKPGGTTSTDDAAAPPELVVVFNWHQELLERVPIP